LWSWIGLGFVFSADEEMGCVLGLVGWCRHRRRIKQRLRRNPPRVVAVVANRRKRFVLCRWAFFGGDAFPKLVLKCPRMAWLENFTVVFNRLVTDSSSLGQGNQLDGMTRGNKQLYSCTGRPISVK
jgi:hypothetical protein